MRKKTKKLSSFLVKKKFFFVTKFTEDEYDYDALNLINEHIEMSDSEYRVVDDYVTSESESED
ncbi:hypothetical protein BpHYR1_003674 [Brachionus plicatilis]|uniref:Uncharacterized protein n=1 Tax=Brachionus plicatilis TaxID=10195 RepID=A0A3M7SAW3_BRAPC|nr:hypothetical protein BpHYR1_003674 [Brachionus plicatilis]